MYGSPCVLRSLLRLVLTFTVVLSAAAGPQALAATASELVPAAAPHGARVIVVGSGLDAPELRVVFSDGSGGSIAAPVLLRSPLMLEVSVPRGAASGPVRLAGATTTIATFPFTIAADSGFVAVSTIVSPAPSPGALKAPAGTFVDRSSGDLYVADRAHHRILRVHPNGSVETVIPAGTPAQLKEPRAVVFDAARSVLYVADTGNHVIRRLAGGGAVEILAGSGRPGDADGSGAAARLHHPTGLALDREGNLYVADSGNHKIRKVTPAGAVTTVAGAGRPGHVDGTAANALFHAAEGVAVGADGTVYVADTRNHACDHALRRVARQLGVGERR